MRLNPTEGDLLMTRKGLSVSPKFPQTTLMSDDNTASSREFGSPYQILLDHCESGDLKFHAVDEHKTIFFAVRGEFAVYDITLMITHNDEVLQIYVTIPVAVTREKLRPLVGEFVTRANHSLVIGHFDFDLDDGKLRYHVGHAFGDRGLDDGTIGRLMATALDTADRYFPALMQVMFAGHTPADAIFQAELDYHSEELKESTPISTSSAPLLKNAKPATKKKGRRRRKSPQRESAPDLSGSSHPRAEEKSLGDDGRLPKS